MRRLLVVSSAVLFQGERTALSVLDRRGSCAVAVADLFHREPTSAYAATPAGTRRWRDSGGCLLIGAPGSHEFATALRTLSLDHKSYREELSCYAA